MDHSINDQKTHGFVDRLKEFLESKNQLMSYVFMMSSCFFWACGYIYPNEHKFTPIQTNLARSITLVPGIFLICRLLSLNIQFKSPKTWRVLLKRHIAFLIQNLYVAGVQFILPLSILHTIATAGPIIILVMQHFLYRNVSIEGWKLKGSIIAFIGILLTSNGKYIYGYIDQSFVFESQFQNYITTSYFYVILATVFLILTMSLWAYGVLLTQEANSHAFEMVFHFGVTNLFVSSLVYTAFQQTDIESENMVTTSEFYWALLWTGGSLLCADICFGLALNMSKNIGLTSISSFFIVIVGYGLSVIRYGEPLDVVSVLGSFLVVIGVGLVITTKDSQKVQEHIQHEKDIQCRKDKISKQSSDF